jgi:hypothetical protein
MHKWGLRGYHKYRNPIQPQQVSPLDDNNPFEACETRQELKCSFRSGDRNDQYFVFVLMGKRTFVVPIQSEVGQNIYALYSMYSKE